MNKIKSNAKKDYKVYNYKGLDYSYVWYNNKKQQVLGQMCYSINMPKLITHSEFRGVGNCTEWTNATWTIESLFNYFDTAKDMKSSIDNFIETYSELHQKILREQTNGAWPTNEIIFYRLACICMDALPLNSQAGVRTMSDQLKRLKRKYPELSRIVFNFNKTNKENDGKRIEKMMSVKDHALYIKLTNSEEIKWIM